MDDNGDSKVPRPLVESAEDDGAEDVQRETSHDGGAAVSSLVLGTVWFAWHVPLQFLPGTANTGLPLALWGVSIVATAFVYTWLFNNTGGSVLAVTVFHGLFNVVGPFLALHPSVTGNPLSAYVTVGVNVLSALAILGVYRSASFTRRVATAATELDE